MAARASTMAPVSRPGKIILAAMYLLYAAVLIRTLTNPNISSRLPVYLALEILYLLLLSLALWRPPRQRRCQQLYLGTQAALVLILIGLRPRFDFIVILNIILTLQVDLMFTGQPRWIWIGLLAMLTSVPLMVGLGALQGLALALMPMTIGIIFAAYASVTQEIEQGLRKREALLLELREAHQRLTASAAQAEELSAIQERERLARELHDSVSQTIFSISLVTRAAQLLQRRDPQRLRPQLEQLKILTHSALAEMRSLIAQLRPAEGESAGKPTP